MIYMFNIYRAVEGGVVRWKELISLKEDKERKSMDLEREWKLSQEEIYFKDVEEKAEKNCQHKAAKCGLFVQLWWF